MTTSAAPVAAAPAAPRAIAQIIEQVPAIGTLPDVATRVLETIRNPNSSSADLHKIICRDPALAARLLKVANSAFYGRPGQVGSIERAIVLLGLSTIKNLAVSASLSKLFSEAAPLWDRFTARDLWTHSLAVAVTARELARGMKLPLADEAFLAGLIHDVGLLVSLQVFGDRFRDVCKAAAAGGLGETFVELERRHVGFDHQQLGAAVAAHWKFPRPCQVVAEHHHRPSGLGNQDSLLAMLVHTADTMCCRTDKHGFNLTAAGQTLDPVALKAAGLEPAVVDRVAQRLEELLSSASDLMN